MQQTAERPSADLNGTCVPTGLLPLEISDSSDMTAPRVKRLVLIALVSLMASLPDDLDVLRFSLPATGQGDRQERTKESRGQAETGPNRKQTEADERESENKHGSSSRAGVCTSENLTVHKDEFSVSHARHHRRGRCVSLRRCVVRRRSCTSRRHDFSLYVQHENGV